MDLYVLHRWLLYCVRKPGSVSIGLVGMSVGVVLRDTCFISSTTKKSGQLFINCRDKVIHNISEPKSANCIYMYTDRKSTKISVVGIYMHDKRSISTEKKH